MQFNFGSGALLAQRNDIANTTPLNFGLVQDVTLDIAFTTKELFGQNQWALAIGRGTAKATVKAKVAQISGLSFANFALGLAPQSGYTTTSFGESATVASATPVTANTNAATAAANATLHFSAVPAGVLPGALITDTTTEGVIPPGTYVLSTAGTTVVMSAAATGGGVVDADTISFTPGVSPANILNFAKDWGVVSASTGIPMTAEAVGTTLASGQYYVGPTGAYFFYSGDNGKQVLLNYSFNVAGTGQKLALINPLSGTTPSFSARLFTTFQGKTIDVLLYNLVSSKLSFGTKLEDFTIPEFDAGVFANPAGNVFDWNFSEAS